MRQGVSEESAVYVEDGKITKHPKGDNAKKLNEDVDDSLNEEYRELFETWLKENGLKSDRRYYSSSDWKQLQSEYDRFVEFTKKFRKKDSKVNEDLNVGTSNTISTTPAASTNIKKTFSYKKVHDIKGDHWQVFDQDNNLVATYETEELAKKAIQNKGLNEEIGDNLLDKDKKFRYQMLSRMQSDCNYFIGNGNKNPKVLWAQDVDDHIKVMKKLYNSFDEKDRPEWISLKDIEDYYKKMKSKKLNEEYDPFKDMEKVDDEEWRKGLYTDGNGSFYKAPSSGTSDWIKRKNYKFRYNFSKKQLEVADNSEDVFYTADLSLGNWLDGPEYWFDKAYQEMRDEEDEYLKDYLSKHPEYTEKISVEDDKADKEIEEG